MISSCDRDGASGSASRKVEVKVGKEKIKDEGVEELAATRSRMELEASYM